MDYTVKQGILLPIEFAKQSVRFKPDLDAGRRDMEMIASELFDNKGKRLHAQKTIEEES